MIPDENPGFLADEALQEASMAGPELLRIARSFVTAWCIE
jgi:hypothetical protein